MNYPELIWRLIELVLQKEKDHNDESDNNDSKKGNQLNADLHDETL